MSNDNLAGAAGAAPSRSKNAQRPRVNAMKKTVWIAIAVVLVGLGGVVLLGRQPGGAAEVPHAAGDARRLVHRRDRHGDGRAGGDHRRGGADRRQRQEFRPRPRPSRQDDRLPHPASRRGPCWRSWTTFPSRPSWRRPASISGWPRPTQPLPGTAEADGTRLPPRRGAARHGFGGRVRKGRGGGRDGRRRSWRWPRPSSIRRRSPPSRPRSI